jgi:hypothetical protein
MDARAFYLHIADALSGCQLVEQELKLYISEALELVENCVGGRLPFKMTGEDYEDSSLERLIDTFKKLSDNPTLVIALRKFKDERNFLSHNGITHCLDYEGEFDEAAASQFEVRLLAIGPEAERLRIAIHEEANTFRGHLWFGEFPDAA